MTIANAIALADQPLSPPSPSRYCEPLALSFDFDGTLADSKGRRWLAEPGLDLRPLAEAWEHGYVVFVLTVNDTAKVAALLRKAGVDAIADTGNYALPYWHGGLGNGRVVLVTNRKLKARAYIDDRGLRYGYGEDPAAIWAELDRRHGKRPGMWRRLGSALAHAAEVMGSTGTSPYGMS